ncbi:MAG: MBL fold metallo-hydrolase [Lachnospiraceae bacterium]|nr:MBL fold metallo-hydrolase [Lachnospiraceae bacterium]
MEELNVGCIVLGVLENNCYFIHREGETDTIFIDPNSQGDKLFVRLREKGLEIKAILLTHGHFDHIMGANEMRQISGAKIYACEDEEELLGDPGMNSSYKVGRPYTVKPDVLLKDGEEINVGSMKFKVIKTPGHTVGGCCFYSEEDKVLFSGDTLFCESCGRTDFETGNAGLLKQSLRKLMELPEDVKVYPGHGEFTTIEHEKMYNPYLNM